jgi:hypothetical protein
MRRSDLELTRIIAERSASNPVSMAEVSQLFSSRGLTGRMADWWLNRRGQIVLYRGQGGPTTEILSPFAREHGLAASEVFVSRMRDAGITNHELAFYTAQFHTQPVPPHFTLPELAWEPLGAAGIPMTRIPGVGAGFGETGVVYVIRLPKSATIEVPPWGLAVENEWVVLNRVPPQAVVGVIPAARIPPLTANARGALVRGAR